uniref:Uncharacterized protein n=1 Tax=Knipowitschia caucasica TaxID=637954 RepID=A0AAV2IWG2_KNICA
MAPEHRCCFCTARDEMPSEAVQTLCPHQIPLLPLSTGGKYYEVKCVCVTGSYLHRASEAAELLQFQTAGLVPLLVGAFRDDGTSAPLCTGLVPAGAE